MVDEANKEKDQRPSGAICPEYHQKVLFKYLLAYIKKKKKRYKGTEFVRL